MAGSVPWASVLNVDHTPASGEAAPAVAVLVLCVLPWPKSSLRPGGLTRFCQSGILAHGFLRLHCADCAHEKLVAFSCKRRGFCPACGARRMAETAAHLVDHVIPWVPVANSR
jgi:ribosomal protein S27E